MGPLPTVDASIATRCSYAAPFVDDLAACSLLSTPLRKAKALEGSTLPDYGPHDQTIAESLPFARAGINLSWLKSRSLRTVDNLTPPTNISMSDLC